MVEIFTTAAGKDGGASRVVANDIRLSAPSTVHFGSGVPGVAYFEKSGADLRVTLLDGQEVLIRDFFVIGAGGEYSSLLDGGAGGEVEVTGLIAPEPFLPASEQPTVVQTADETAPAPEQKPAEAEHRLVEVHVEDGAAGGTAAVAADASAGEEGGQAGGDAEGGIFGGFGLDGLLFFASYGLVGIHALSSSGGHSDDGAEPVTETSSETAPADTQAVAAEISSLVSGGEDTVSGDDGTTFLSSGTEESPDDPSPAYATDTSGNLLDDLQYAAQTV